MDYLFYPVAGMWALGCIVLTVLFFIWLLENERIITVIGISFVTIPLGCLLAAVPFLLKADNDSPDLATLKKGEWLCTASHPVDSVMVVSTGKSTIVVPSVETICDRYSRVAK